MIECWHYGRNIDLSNLEDAGITAHELATSLSRIYRFCGQGATVLEHSLVVGMVAHWLACPDKTLLPEGGTSAIYRAGLLHDCHEIWAGDCIRPVHQWCERDRGRIPEFEAYADRVLMKQFHAASDKPYLDLVKRADNASCAWEYARLSGAPIGTAPIMLATGDAWAFVAQRGNVIDCFVEGLTS